MSAQVATVGQLKARGEAALLGLTTSTPASKTAVAALRGAELPWRFLAGRLHGNVDSGDLELRDGTGAVAVSIDASGADTGRWRAPGGADVTIRVDATFTLVAEAVDQVDVPGSSPSIAHAVRVPISNIAGVEIVDSEDEDAPVVQRTSKHESGLKDIFVMVTHIASTTRETNRWAISVRPQYRHIHGVVFHASYDALATGLVEKMHCVELLVGADCESAWHVKKHGLYRVRASRVRSASDKSTGFDVLAPSDDHAVRALQNAWQDRGANKRDQLDAELEGDTLCILPVIDEVERVMTAAIGELSAHRKLRVYRVDRRGSFEPIVFQPRAAGALGDGGSACTKHEECQQAHQGASPRIKVATTSSATKLVLCSSVQPLTAVHRLPDQTLCYITALMAVMRRRDAQSWRQVSTLIAHGTANEPATAAPEANIHQPRLMTLIGAVRERRYYWRDNPHYGEPEPKVDASVVGEKRCHEEMSSPGVDRPSIQSRRLVCVVRVRDLSSLDTIDIHIDVHKFGFRASLQPGDVVEFSKLQGFIARSTFRAYLNWGYLTSARLLQLVDSSLPSEAELYGSLQTSFLNDLYSTKSSSKDVFDRRIHRYVVRVVYVNYVVLKRKCRACHRALVHDRRHGWMHSTPTNGESSVSQPSRQCGWYQLQHMDAALASHSYVHTNMRCIIDDGSAQAELFLENEVAWELLRCSPTQRRHLLDVRISELRFFAGQTPTSAGFFSSAGTSEDEQYYENQLREVVLSAVAELRQLAVFAQRFYSKAREVRGAAQGRGGADSGPGPTSILTFGRDVQVVTRTATPAKLDARRVDDLHVKSELRQLLARLRASQ
jgi:hypothetical protein